jgi:hypothetical protein
MANDTKSDARRRAKPGPPPTLRQELADGYSWFWFLCPVCDRRTPRALAPLAIRCGMDVPTIDIARAAMCLGCGHKGALLQRPSLDGTGSDQALEPFPAELAARQLGPWLARITRTKCPAPLLRHSESRSAFLSGKMSVNAKLATGAALRIGSRE